MYVVCISYCLSKKSFSKLGITIENEVDLSFDNYFHEESVIFLHSTALRSKFKKELKIDPSVPLRSSRDDNKLKDQSCPRCQNAGGVEKSNFVGKD